MTGGTIARTAMVERPEVHELHASAIFATFAARRRFARKGQEDAFGLHEGLNSTCTPTGFRWLLIIRRGAGPRRAAAATDRSRSVRADAARCGGHRRAAPDRSGADRAGAARRADSAPRPARRSSCRPASARSGPANRRRATGSSASPRRLSSRTTRSRTRTRVSSWASIAGLASTLSRARRSPLRSGAPKRSGDLCGNANARILALIETGLTTTLYEARLVCRIRRDLERVEALSAHYGEEP